MYQSVNWNACSLFTLKKQNFKPFLEQASLSLSKQNNQRGKFKMNSEINRLQIDSHYWIELNSFAPIHAALSDASQHLYGK